MLPQNSIVSPGLPTSKKSLVRPHAESLGSFVKVQDGGGSAPEVEQYEDQMPQQVYNPAYLDNQILPTVDRINQEKLQEQTAGISGSSKTKALVSEIKTQLKMQRLKAFIDQEANARKNIGSSTSINPVNTKPQPNHKSSFTQLSDHDKSVSNNNQT